MARIVVDLLGYTGTRGGTETYARELLSRLPTHLPDVDFVALANRAGAREIGGFFPGDIHTVGWVGEGRIGWAAAEVAAVDRAARRVSAALVWSPANFGPVTSRVRRIVTIHDAIYHEVPGGIADRVLRAGSSWLMTRSARSADGILTVSHAAARAVREHMGVDERRITVVHNGSSTPHPPSDPWTALRALEVPSNRPVLLSLGNRMPHKNFEGLLAALAEIDPAERPLAVLPGGRARDPLHGHVERLALTSDVLLTGWISDEQVEALYAVAALYVCPSLVEGFGLPVVDALRRGCAVLANDIPVLREVGGDVAEYVDARNPRELALHISRLVAQQDDSARRAARIAWASQFTWDAAAAGTARAIRELLTAADHDVVA